jgi:cyclic pyranopterin phosphate synthase
VWEGIQEAERLGFSPIKLNVFAIKGVNDDEIEAFGSSHLKSHTI